MQGTQTAEVAGALQEFEVQPGPGQLTGDDHPHQEPDHTPERGHDDPGADDSVHVFALIHHFRLANAAQHHHEGDGRHQHDFDRVDQIGQIARVIGGNRGTYRDHAQRDQFNLVPHFASLRPCPSALGARATRPGTEFSTFLPSAYAALIFP